MTYLNMWITDNNNNYGKWSNAEYDAIIADCTTGQYVSDGFRSLAGPDTTRRRSSWTRLLSFPFTPRPMPA